MDQEQYREAIIKNTKVQLRHSKYIKEGLEKDIASNNNCLCDGELEKQGAELAISFLSQELENISSVIISLEETLKGYEELRKRSNPE